MAARRASRATTDLEAVAADSEVEGFAVVRRRFSTGVVEEAAVAARRGVLMRSTRTALVTFAAALALPAWSFAQQTFRFFLRLRRTP